MPMGMWTMFAPSFRKQLTAVFGYDTGTANKTDAGRASVPLFLWRDSNGSALTEPAGESESLPLRQSAVKPQQKPQGFPCGFCF